LAFATNFHAQTVTDCKNFIYHNAYNDFSVSGAHQ